MKSDALNSFVSDAMSGRHSRRELFKQAAALGIGATAAGALINRAAAQGTGSLEIFSWWTSPGEAPALEALFTEYANNNPDVEIVNAAVAGGGQAPCVAGCGCAANAARFAPRAPGQL